LARVLASDLGSQNIRVNAIAPGLIRTKFSQVFWEGTTNNSPLTNTFLQRVGDPEDIAGTAAYLLSEDSAFITGETIVVTGGGTSRM